MTPTILVVDDEPAVRFTLASILEDRDMTVIEATNGAEALQTIEAAPRDLDLVITDLKMPQMDGMSLLEAVEALEVAPSVIMITAHGDERTAVEAMKRGALDYFKKPFDAAEIARVVERSLALVALAEENRRLRAELALGRTMVFSSEAMFHIAEIVERVAPRDVTVLISGESGTGKELVAEAIVKASGRARCPFVRFNCAALPTDLAAAELFGHKRGAFTGATGERRGLFRQAHTGSLMLDEVNSLDLKTQGMLLRVIQEGQLRPVGQDRTVPVDVRLLATTNQDLREVEGFRQDLYYRLSVVPIHIPPLRERRDDIEPLTRHFARIYGERFGFGPDVDVTDGCLARFCAATWPGNVRQLQHTVARLLAIAREPVLDDDGMNDIGNGTAEAQVSLKERVDAFERQLIAEALARYGGNQSETARQLSVSRATLISKMKKYGLR